MVVPVFTDRITRVGQGCDGTERLEYPSNTNRSGLNTLVIRTVGNQGNVNPNPVYHIYLWLGSMASVTIFIYGWARWLRGS